MNRVDQQQAYILKSQSFKENSYIHQIFSRDFGVVSVISRGSKAKISKTGSILQPFRPLCVSWSGKSDLKTLTSVEQAGDFKVLKGNALYCGFYVNELVLSLLHKFDSHPLLYDAFQQVLCLLGSTENLESSLRYFEKSLLEETGYGLQLEYEADNSSLIDPSINYEYIIGRGAVQTTQLGGQYVISGSAITSLKNNVLTDKLELLQVKKLMRRLIDDQLNGKILKSRELFLK